MNEFQVKNGKNSNPASLTQVACLFLRLGCLSIGGPAVHIAAMEDEIVSRRKWISRETFLDLLGATNLIPGPNSTELAIHIGKHICGWPGLIVAGVCFIMPAMLIVMMIAWTYVTYAKMPPIEGILYGIKPAIVAIVFHALWKLGKTAVKSLDLLFVGTICLIFAVLRMNEFLILFLAGIGLLAKRNFINTNSNLYYIFISGVSFSSTLANQAWASLASATNSVPFSVTSLFWFFFKIASVLYGSGYVLLAFLQSGLVEERGWLTEAQLIDSFAIGQITPGPVFTTATFIGFILSGPKAALMATLGIFLPSFIFVAISAPLISRIRKSKIAGDFLDAVNVASLALMAFVTWQLGHSTLIDMPSVTVAAISAFLLIFYRINSTWIIALTALFGFLYFKYYRNI